ncbi:Histidine-containing phosphotransfer protein 4 [Capsicum annuum]|uniref:Histidine-containing phosphotransfer protein n=1 Tax=Capsicum annuum TaxID=4072 RepID=A0A2G2YWW7_CAPAN|nr:Histidine-containing phosphotransfer protein 4 [Capsicum annuum]
MQRQAASMKRSLFNQEYLDEQFNELEELQDDDNPDFVEEAINLFFTDSVRLIRNIDLALQVVTNAYLDLSRANGPYDFGKLDGMIHQFKGSSSRYW